MSHSRSGRKTFHPREGETSHSSHSTTRTRRSSSFSSSASSAATAATAESLSSSSVSRSRTADQSDVSEWVFRRFNELTSPHATSPEREEILYKVFWTLQKCDPTWQCQLDILDVFGSILESKPEILFGCSNVLDLILTMIENLEKRPHRSTRVSSSDFSRSSSDLPPASHLSSSSVAPPSSSSASLSSSSLHSSSEKPSTATANANAVELRITTAHCKLCHLIAVVGRTQLTAAHLNRILILLRDSLTGQNRGVLAGLLLHALLDMTKHSPPSLGPSQNSKRTSEAMSMLLNSTVVESSSPKTSVGSTPSSSAVTSPSLARRKSGSGSGSISSSDSTTTTTTTTSSKKSGGFLDAFRPFRSKSTAATNNLSSPSSKSSRSPSSGGSSSSKSSKDRRSKDDSSALSTSNTLLRIVHQLPLSSFAFLKNNEGIRVPMKAIHTWPLSKGFTFAGWLQWTQIDPYLSPSSSSSTSGRSSSGVTGSRVRGSSVEQHWMCLFSMLTISGYGIEICLSERTGQLKVRVMWKSNVDERVIPKVRLLASNWYFVTVTVSPVSKSPLKYLASAYGGLSGALSGNSGMSGGSGGSHYSSSSMGHGSTGSGHSSSCPGICSVRVNAGAAIECELSCPNSTHDMQSEKPSYCAIGTQCYPVSSKSKPVSFVGQLGAMYLFAQPLRGEDISLLYSFGANYMMPPEVIAESRTWIEKYFFGDSGATGSGHSGTPGGLLGSFAKLGSAIVSPLMDTSSSSSSSSSMSHRPSGSLGGSSASGGRGSGDRSKPDSSSSSKGKGIGASETELSLFANLTFGYHPLACERRLCLNLATSSHLSMEHREGYISVDGSPLGSPGPGSHGAGSSGVSGSSSGTKRRKPGGSGMAVPSSVAGSSGGSTSMIMSGSQMELFHDYLSNEAVSSLHGTLKSGIEKFDTSDVRNIFHCSIGGQLILLPILRLCDKYYYTRNPEERKSLQIIEHVLQLLVQLTHYSSSNREEMARKGVIPILAYIMSQWSMSTALGMTAMGTGSDPSPVISGSLSNHSGNYLLNEKILSTVIRMCTHLSWLGFEDSVNANARPPSDSMLFSHLPPSLTDSRQMLRLRIMDVSQASDPSRLVNKCILFLLFNFRLWHQPGVSAGVEVRVASQLQEWCIAQPRYFYRLLSVKVLLDEVRQHLVYGHLSSAKDGSDVASALAAGSSSLMLLPTELLKTRVWMWNLRQMYFEMVSFLFTHGSPGIEPSNVELLLQMALELTDPLESADVMEVLVSIFEPHKSVMEKRWLAQMSSDPTIQENYSKNTSVKFRDAVYDLILKYGGPRLFAVLFRQQCCSAIVHFNAVPVQPEPHLKTDDSTEEKQATEKTSDPTASSSASIDSSSLSSAKPPALFPPASSQSTSSSTASSLSSSAVESTVSQTGSSMVSGSVKVSAKMQTRVTVKQQDFLQVSCLHLLNVLLFQNHSAISRLDKGILQTARALKPEEERSLVNTLVNGFSDQCMPVTSYQALLEILTAQKPGSIGAMHGTEFAVKAQDIRDNRLYQPKLAECFLRYPSAMLLVLGCAFEDEVVASSSSKTEDHSSGPTTQSSSAIMSPRRRGKRVAGGVVIDDDEAVIEYNNECVTPQIILEDLMTLLASSKHRRHNCRVLSKYPGFQNNIIRFLDFQNADQRREVQSPVGSTAWYAETVLDLLLTHAMVSSHEGWKTMQDTLRLMRNRCEVARWPIQWCVRLQCFLIIRVLKRVSRELQFYGDGSSSSSSGSGSSSSRSRRLSLSKKGSVSPSSSSSSKKSGSGSSGSSSSVNVEYTKVNIIFVLELIERICYDLSPGLYSSKLSDGMAELGGGSASRDDWVVCEPTDKVDAMEGPLTGGGARKRMKMTVMDDSTLFADSSDMECSSAVTTIQDSTLGVSEREDDSRQDGTSVNEAPQTPPMMGITGDDHPSVDTPAALIRDESIENIDSTIIDEIWLLLCESVLESLEVIPKVSLSPQDWSGVTTSTDLSGTGPITGSAVGSVPSAVVSGIGASLSGSNGSGGLGLKAGSPFRALQRICLSCLERNLHGHSDDVGTEVGAVLINEDSSVQTRLNRSCVFIQSMLQYLPHTGHPHSAKMLESISVANPRYPLSEMTNKFVVCLLYNLHEMHVMAQSDESRHALSKLVTFVSNSREPYGFIPLTIFDFDHPEFAEATVDGIKLKTQVEKALSLGYSHWVVPMQSYCNSKNEGRFEFQKASKLRVDQKALRTLVDKRLQMEAMQLSKSMDRLNGIVSGNHGGGDPEVVEAQMICNLLEKYDNLLNYDVEYYKKLLRNEESKMNRLAYKEANRRASSIDYSEEKLRRGKLLWFKAVPFIFNERSVWYPLSQEAKQMKKRRKVIWQIDENSEDSHRMRRKLLPYKGAMLKTRSAAESYSKLPSAPRTTTSSSSSSAASALGSSSKDDDSEMNYLRESIANLSKIESTLHSSKSDESLEDSETKSEQQSEEELSEMRDEWDFCESGHMRKGSESSDGALRDHHSTMSNEGDIHASAIDSAISGSVTSRARMKGRGSNPNSELNADFDDGGSTLMNGGNHQNRRMDDEEVLFSFENCKQITRIGSFEGKLQVTNHTIQFLCGEAREKYESQVQCDEQLKKREMEISLLYQNDTAERKRQLAKLQIESREELSKKMQQQRKKKTGQKSSSSMDDSDRRRHRVSTAPIPFTLPALNKVRLEMSRDIYINLSEIHAIFRRRYLLQHKAIEIFLTDGKSLMFILQNKSERTRLLKGLLGLHNHMPYLDTVFSRRPSVIVEKLQLTQRWQNREISNFDYLMQLNTISGRTYNDLNQYHVFPFVLADYVSEQLDLNNPYTFRDLSKPIGALNPDRLKTILKRYSSLAEDSEVKAFHYGSFYSNAAIVISYLIRLEPFASLHIELQGGKFDFPDRLFSSVPTLFDTVTTSLSTFKELIPEFFYNANIFENVNKYDFGRRQSGEDVENVILPPWASSAEEFVRIHRCALESEYVSMNLHHWIDLIFGVKQRGSMAEESCNLFYHLTYEGNVDIDTMDDDIMAAAVLSQIEHFGQVPQQIFMDQLHPQRKPAKFPSPPRLLPHSGVTPAPLTAAPPVPPVSSSIIPSKRDDESVIPCLHALSVTRGIPIVVSHKIGSSLLTVSAAGQIGIHTVFFDYTDPSVQEMNLRNVSPSQMKMSIPASVASVYGVKCSPKQYDVPPFSVLSHSHSSKHTPPSLAHGCVLAFNPAGNIAYVGNNWDWSLRVYNMDLKTLSSSSSATGTGATTMAAAAAVPSSSSSSSSSTVIGGGTSKLSSTLGHHGGSSTPGIHSHSASSSAHRKRHAMGDLQWTLSQSLVSHKGKVTCVETDGIHVATGSEDCTVVIWECVTEIKLSIAGRKRRAKLGAFLSEGLFSSSSAYSYGSGAHGTSSSGISSSSASALSSSSPSSAQTPGSISQTVAVLRGHQSSITCLAIDTELDICVSCSAEGLVLVHNVKDGQYRHSLYLSTDICGRGPSLTSLDAKHFPKGKRDALTNIEEYLMESDLATAHPHARPRGDPESELTPMIAEEMTEQECHHSADSVIAINEDHFSTEASSKIGLDSKKALPMGVKSSKSLQVLGSSLDESDGQSLSSRGGWGNRAVVDLIRISCDGTLVFLSKLSNTFFTCDVNGAHWSSLQVSDNVMAMQVHRSGKLLLTGGQCGTASLRYLHDLNREIARFSAVGDSITCVQFEHSDNNRLWIATENGKLNLFAVPKLFEINATVDLPVFNLV